MHFQETSITWIPKGLLKKKKILTSKELQFFTEEKISFYFLY